MARRVVVIGSGIAGIETALTLREGVPDAHISVVGPWATLRILPNLVYVPFGIRPHTVDLKLNRLLVPAGIDLCTGTCERIDTDAHEAWVDGTAIGYDVAVVATGLAAVPAPPAGAAAPHSVRTLDAVGRLRDALAGIPSGNGAAEAASTVVVRIPDGTPWAAPAYEIALLAAQWARATGRGRLVRISLVSAESMPLELLGGETSALVTGLLDDAGIEFVPGASPATLQAAAGDVVVDFTVPPAAPLAGMPAPTAQGFFHAREDGTVAPDVYVVGDATDSPFKAAFNTTMQARALVPRLGGDLSLVGTAVDGVPIDRVEYQMDIGGQTLVVRMPAVDLRDGGVVQGARPLIEERVPVKLRGLLLRQKLGAAAESSIPALEYRRLVGGVTGGIPSRT